MFKKIIKKILPKPLVSALSQYYDNYNNLKNASGLMALEENISVTKNCEFEKTVMANKNTVFCNCKVGRFSYFSGGNTVRNCKIGRYCSIAYGAYIGLGPHPIEKIVSSHPFFYNQNKDDIFFKHGYADKKYYETEILTEIGNDVWIGTNALIKSGLKIGDGAVIGAGAVVTKNVEPYAIVAGVPAKLIRYRFTEPQIKFLLKFRWWEKSDAWLRKNWKDFLDIEKLMEKYEK